jgi:O-antigen/teichoic acid export membrane protein
MVSQPDGYAALGVFIAADKWRQLVLFLPTSLSAIILPMLSNLHGTKNTGGYRQVFSANVLVIFSGPAMSAYGSDYQAGRVTLIILSASAVAVVLNNVLGQVLVSLGSIWWRCGLDVALAVLLALSAWWLIPTYQENGLALANLIAFAITALILLLIVRYFFRQKELLADAG